MRILVTGHRGYIGSVMTPMLQNAGHEVVGLDNYANSSPEVLRRLARIAGREPAFVQADVTDRAALPANLAARDKLPMPMWSATLDIVLPA